MGAACFSGCSDKIDGTQTALVINGEEASLGTVNFIFRYQQAMTYYYIQMMGMSSDSFWSSAYDDSTTYGEYFKDNIYDSIVELYAAKQKAIDEYGVELTEEEESAIQEAAQAFMDANPEAEANFGVTLEQVEEVLELYTYSNDVKPFLITDVDTEVSDDEAAQSRIIYVRIAKNDEDTDSSSEDTSSTSADSSEEETYTNDELYAQAEDVLAQIKEDPDQDSDALNTLADAVNEDFFAMEYTYGDDDDSFDTAVTDAVDTLSDGEWYDGVIEGDSYYYLVKLVAAFDEEATETKKESIVSERKTDAIEAKFEEWREAAEVETKSVWDKLELSDDEVYTVATAASTDSTSTDTTSTSASSVSESSASSTSSASSASSSSAAE